MTAKPLTAEFVIYPAKIKFTSRRKYPDSLVVKGAIKAVEQQTQITYNQMLKLTRESNIVFARFMIWKLVKDNSTSLTLGQIGKFFSREVRNRKTKIIELRGFDHSSVIHGIQRIDDMEVMAERGTLGIDVDNHNTWVLVKKNFIELLQQNLVN
jgi:chromosomal replication initiation ATPase DnaA